MVCYKILNICFCVLYNRSLLIIFCCSVSLIWLLIYPSPSSPLVSLFSASVSLFLFVSSFVSFSFRFLMKWYHVIVTFVCLVSLAVINIGSIHVAEALSLLFHGWVVFHRSCTTSSSFICWWSLRSLPCLAVVNSTSVITLVHVSFLN